MEAEFDAKLQELEAQQQQELAEFSAGAGSGEAPNSESAAPKAAAAAAPKAACAPEEPNKSPEDEERDRKQAKARRKRDKQKQQQRDLERQIAEETLQAGPSSRQMEVEAIQQQLEPLGLVIAEIASDGNCLYRAISASVPSMVGSYQETRAYIFPWWTVDFVCLIFYFMFLPTILLC